MRKSLLVISVITFCPLLVALQTPVPAVTASMSQSEVDPSRPSTPLLVTAASPAEEPRVFITDSESWEMSGSAGGANGTFAAESHGGARPQTAEIIKTFGQRCSEVIVNNRQELADYIVVLDHEGGKGYLRHRNKVAVFEHASGDVVISHSTLSLGGSVEDACKWIVEHWAKHGREILAEKQKATSLVMPAALQQSQLSSQQIPPSQASVAIDSTPPDADIEVDGAFVGNTPSTVNVTPGSHEITVKKKGFVVWIRKLNVTGGSIHLNAELDASPAQ